MKKNVKKSKRYIVLLFLLLFMIQGNLFVANAEVSLPNPSLPNTSLPNPSLPNPSLPNPSLSDANLSNSTLPGVDVDSSENGTNTDGSSNNDDKGWIDSLTDLVQSVGDKLDSFTQNAIDTLGEVGSSIFDGLAEAGQWIADNWEFTAAVVAGVGLTIAGIFVAPLLPIGLSILAGMALSGGIGYFTGLRGEDLTKEMGIGGALGAIGGGLLGSMAKVVGAGGIGLKTLVTGNALSGAITSMADDILHNRKLSIPKAVIGAALGVGLTALLVGGQGLANKIMNPGQVAKPSVSSPKVDVQDGNINGKNSGEIATEVGAGAVDDIFVRGQIAFNNFDISTAYVKPKHLSTSNGNGAKFLGDSKAAAEAILQDVLKSGRIKSITDNGLTKMGQQSYQIIIDAGQKVGTKGETLIKIVISEDGGMLSAYPVK